MFIVHIYKKKTMLQKFKPKVLYILWIYIESKLSRDTNLENDGL